MEWKEHDGGRAAAGFKVATGAPYRDVYNQVNELAKHERPRRGRKRSGARTGVRRPTAKRYMERIGWEWVPTMGIGTGCRVHLRKEDLPSGPLVVSLSRHFAAVVDGVVYDTYDPTRDGTRCVYGYWIPPRKDMEGNL